MNIERKLTSIGKFILNQVCEAFEVIVHVTNRHTTGITK